MNAYIYIYGQNSFELLSHRAVGLRFVEPRMLELSWTEHCHAEPSETRMHQTDLIHPEAN